MKSITFYCSSKAVSFINEKVPPIFYTTSIQGAAERTAKFWGAKEGEIEHFLLFKLTSTYHFKFIIFENNAHKIEAVIINILLKTSSKVLNNYKYSSLLQESDLLALVGFESNVWRFFLWYNLTKISRIMLKSGDRSGGPTSPLQENHMLGEH